MTLLHSSLQPRSRPAARGTLASLAAAFLLAGCSTSPGGPTTVWMGQVSAGEQTRQVALRSWTTMKFDNLVRQETDFSCGAAVLATLFNHAYGRRTTERQVLVNMFKIADPDVVREKGFSLLDMKNYVRAIGLNAEGYKVDYAALQQLKVPGIALINVRGYKHFVIIRKVGPHQVQIGDPALGNRVMRRADFEKAWNKVVFVVTGEGFDPNTVLLNPPPPLSAQRLFEQRSPIANAEPADFGFGPAFTFSL